MGCLIALAVAAAAYLAGLAGFGGRVRWERQDRSVPWVFGFVVGAALGAGPAGVHRPRSESRGPAARGTTLG